MAIEVAPLPLPPSADPSKFAEFGREVRGINPGTLTPEQFKEIEELLYKVCIRSPEMRTYWSRRFTALCFALPQCRGHT